MADISTGTTDSNGIAHLTSNTIKFLKFVDITNSSFANPDVTYNGYAADGFLRTAGVASSTKATWASEGEHTTATSSRGLEDGFPKRIFVILTATELVILDADSLAVWMRFTLAGTSTPSDFYALGGSSSGLIDADFVDGVLTVAVSDSSNAAYNGAVVVDFRKDAMLRLSSSTNGVLAPSISKRNSAAVWTSGTSSVASVGLNQVL